MNVCVDFNMNREGSGGGARYLATRTDWSTMPPDTFHYYCTVPDGNRGKYSCFRKDVLSMRPLRFGSSGSRVSILVVARPLKWVFDIFIPVETNK